MVSGVLLKITGMGLAIPNLWRVLHGESIHEQSPQFFTTTRTQPHATQCEAQKLCLLLHSPN